MNSTPLNYLTGCLRNTTFVCLLCVGVFWVSPAVSYATGKHALLIDFSRYSHLTTRTIGADLALLQRTLFDEGYEVRLIENGSRREVIQAIHNLTYRINAGDTVFITVQAGVAMTDRSDDVYILFEDTGVDDIEVDGLSLQGLDTMLDRYSTPNLILVLMLESLGTRIFQFADRGKSTTLAATRDDMQSFVSEQLLMLGKQRTLLSEIDSRDNKSGESDSIATLLVSGMQGKADGNNDGIVDARELQQYVEQHSRFVPVVQGQIIAEPLQSSKLVRTTPVETRTPLATPMIQMATRSLKRAVLTAADAAQHKKVLANWVVMGLLSRQDNLRFYGLMSKIKGRNKNEILEDCYNSYKSLEPTLQNAYLMQKDPARNKLKNLVVADKLKKLLQSVPPFCSGK